MVEMWPHWEGTHISVLFMGKKKKKKKNGQRIANIPNSQTESQILTQQKV